MIAEQREQIEALQDCPLTSMGSPSDTAFETPTLTYLTSPWRKPMGLRSANCRCWQWVLRVLDSFWGSSETKNIIWNHSGLVVVMIVFIWLNAPGPRLAVFRYGDSVVLVTQLRIRYKDLQGDAISAGIECCKADKFQFRMIQMAIYFKEFLGDPSGSP